MLLHDDSGKDLQLGLDFRGISSNGALAVIDPSA
jgi:hypothetical protein